MKNIVIQGILWDKKSSFAKGPALAPPAIREVLHNGSMNYFSEDGSDVQSKHIIDRGDFNISNYLEIEEVTRKNISKGEKILTLGGDHSISYPVIKAVLNYHEKIDILHIDAHADLYDEYEGDRYSHACPFARIMELGKVDRLMQVGIRTLNPHQRNQAKKFNIEMHPMQSSMPSNVEPFQNPLYISLDIDAFDPAFAPGVSHPEPGGLTPREVIDFLKNIKGRVIGADIVEYNPAFDLNKHTAYLSAKMLKELISKMM